MLIEWNYIDLENWICSLNLVNLKNKLDDYENEINEPTPTT